MSKASLFKRIAESGKRFANRPDIPADTKIPQYKELLEKEKMYNDMVERYKDVPHNQLPPSHIATEGDYLEALNGAYNNFADANRLHNDGHIEMYPYFNDLEWSKKQRAAQQGLTPDEYYSIPFLQALEGSQR